MIGKPTSEKAFEDAIESHLVEHAGYTKADNRQFDPELALDKHTLLAFLKETQTDALNALKASYGIHLEEAVVKRIAAECDKRGLLDVVRNGVRDRGQHLHLSYFRPPTRLNPETELRYRQNRLTVMRQMRYDPDSNHTLDLLLSLNGLPIATVELKNAFTGQHSGHAIQQYKARVPTAKTPLLQFKKRALVHFAVDTDDAYMTTRLSRNKTLFLPFNTGNQGNPDNHSYQTGYLWEAVWQRDSWLDIIHRFIHLYTEKSTGKTPKETLIFPRYHHSQRARQYAPRPRRRSRRASASANYPPSLPPPTIKYRR